MMDRREGDLVGKRVVSVLPSAEKSRFLDIEGQDIVRICYPGIALPPLALFEVLDTLDQPAQELGPGIRERPVLEIHGVDMPVVYLHGPFSMPVRDPVRHADDHRIRRHRHVAHAIHLPCPKWYLCRLSYYSWAAEKSRFRVRQPAATCHRAADMTRSIHHSQRSLAMGSIEAALWASCS